MSQLLPHEAEYFFKLHRSLMDFTNKKYAINSRLKSVEDFQDLSRDELQGAIPAIRDKMYVAANIKDFCDKNPYNFKVEDLDVIRQWQGKLAIDGFLMKHLREHSVVMATPAANKGTGRGTRLYGIKGISHSLEDFFPKNGLPYQANFILLPFLEHVIYDGFLSTYSIHFGSNMRRSFTNEYNQIKATDGIYSKYSIGDDLANPPKTAAIKDVIAHYIKEALDQGEFPHKALVYAEKHNERAVFEKEYTTKYIKNDKKNLKANQTLPKMHYAAYRETIIAVQPTKKDLLAFCQQHYPKIVDYITVFSV
ncbi:hypothetical protein [Cysteiniphilum sp. JM-1]|uniref:hypothetical protein n=1 Tax=Cysteiniphilum sp. JM-1 TaxID=2610891 RepID=UPI0012458871|nr:hypothetical protein [Cysteiniphilum sp. JM-1]